MVRESDTAIARPAPGSGEILSGPGTAHAREPLIRAEQNATVRKILRGAIAALGRHGSQSLSMSDVALAANVSRATLYRYFPTKGDVLEAVSEYISTTFVRGCERIAREIADPMERLKAIMALQLELAKEEVITRITEVEPSLVLKFLADHYDRHVDAIRRVLDPLYDQLEEAAGVELERDVLAASVLRMHLSLVIVPANQRWQTSPDVIANMLAGFMREAGAASRGKPRARKISK
jgi:AcrR family transcriptional regulator